MVKAQRLGSIILGSGLILLALLWISNGTGNIYLDWITSSLYCGGCLGGVILLVFFREDD